MGEQWYLRERWRNRQRRSSPTTFPRTLTLSSPTAPLPGRLSDTSSSSRAAFDIRLSHPTVLRRHDRNSHRVGQPSPARSCEQFQSGRVRCHEQAAGSAEGAWGRPLTGEALTADAPKPGGFRGRPSLNFHGTPGAAPFGPSSRWEKKRFITEVLR